MSRTTRQSIPNAFKLILTVAPVLANAFYLPGVAPTSYAEGDSVPLHVNRLTPSDTDDHPNVESVYSFDYYNPEFHFCQPNGGPKSVSESLGSIIFGDRIFTSPIELSMRRDETCKSVCTDGAPTKFSAKDASLVNQRIAMNYLYNWLVDGLPAGTKNLDLTTGEEFTAPGFALGAIDLNTGKTLIHNHYDITVDYHEAGPNEFRVVGFHVEPDSRADNNVKSGVAQCGTQGNGLWLDDQSDDQSVHWTYSVRWERSPTSFATRWDKYLHVYDPKIHWFWLINSAVIVCLLVGMISTILLRTLRKDIARYNRLDDIALEDYSGTGIMDDGVQEDSGWKLIHGDVFRPPSYPLPLSVLVGNGAQLFMMTGFTIGKFLARFKVLI